MPPVKPAYLALTIISALLVGIWLVRLQIAEQAISSSLRHFGMDAVVADIDHLGLNSSRLSRLEFAFATGTDRFRLEASGVRIAFQLSQLGEGRADSVTMDRLVVHHASAEIGATGPDTVPEALEPVKIIAVLRQALRQYLVVDALTVNHLSLHGSSFGILQAKPLQLHANSADAELAAELALLEIESTGQAEVIRQLNISRLSADSVIATLEFPQAGQRIPAELDISIHDDRLEGQYSADMASLHEWLFPLVHIDVLNSIGNVTGTFSADFSADKTITSTITSRLDNLNIDAFRAKDLVIQLKIRTTGNGRFQHLKIANGSYLKFGGFDYDQLSLVHGSLYLVGDLYTPSDAWRFDGGLSMPTLNASYDAQFFQLADIAAAVSAGRSDLKMRGSFSTAKAPGTFSFKLQHDLLDNDGTLAIDTLKPVDLNAENIKLSHLWTPWPYPFDLLAGDIALTSHTSWSGSGDIAVNSKIQLQNASGHYGEIIFAGLSLDHHLDILPQMRSVKPGRITLSELDSGVTATNISTTLSLETSKTGTLPRVIARDLYGEIFNGSFRGDEMVFDLNSDSNQFEIKAEDIDLAAVVATQQLEDIEVTGRIDGTVPVSINADGVFIEHGAFINDVRAGTIRYNPATGTDQLRQNPLTGIALDALRDFRYSHLSADVNFTPDGMLVVNLQLKGTSPELDTRRPVHLNINTEQNLLSLLKSLRYAESIGASIDQRVRSKYERSTGKNQDNQ